MGGDKMPLKAFFEAVDQRLQACSADQLRDILRQMAGDVAPDHRAGFLKSLQPGKKAGNHFQAQFRQDELLDDIDDLLREIKIEMEKAEDRYEYEYGESYWDDEDGLGPYEEFVAPLTEMFDRADGVFDSGNRALARIAYQKLFEAFAQEDDYGRGVRATDLDVEVVGSSGARYLRAVYETEPAERRPAALFEEMQRWKEIAWGKPVRLTDLIEIAGRPLPEQEVFLSSWIKFLRKQKGAAADRWLREAIQLAEGSQGLETFARKEGRKHPKAYLDWVAALRAEGKLHEALVAAEEALRKLPAGLPVRAGVADHLCAVAQELHQDQALQKGSWEAFAAEPVLTRLLHLWEITPPRQRDQRLRQAQKHLADYLKREKRCSPGPIDFEELKELEGSPAYVSAGVLAHAYLLAGNWKAARDLAARQQPLGWSYSDNPQGVVTPALLLLLFGSADSLPHNLAQLWNWSLAGSRAFYGDEEKADRQRLISAYRTVLGEADIDAATTESLLGWCLQITEKRVEAIVANQHRNSYSKAAVLIGACAEVLEARGQGKRAQALIDRLRERYPRHSSFQKELARALAGHKSFR